MSANKKIFQKGEPIHDLKRKDQGQGEGEGGEAKEYTQVHFKKAS